MFGSDAPVESINPFEGIHAAVTRRRKDGSPGEDGWHPSERLSLNAAIAGFSQNPAGISERHTYMGRIAPGYKADFLILERDPFSIEKQRLAALSPAATFIEGECVFQGSTLPFDFDEINN
jgi:predicted amidohydrolase YtcJ